MYRDVVAALRARRAALASELGELERESVDLEVLRGRIAEARAELRGVDAQLRDHGAPLGTRQLTLASPCRASWDDMEGDGAVRHCQHCRKNVYDLSAMTVAEADQVIAETRGELCARLRLRGDGTVITGDCPVGTARRKRVFAASCSGVLALLVAAGTTALVASRRYYQGAVSTPKSDALNDMRQIRRVAEARRIEVLRCPEAWELSPMGIALRDPWGSPYRIECDADGVRVVSRGEDRKPETADDVRLRR